MLTPLGAISLSSGRQSSHDQNLAHLTSSALEFKEEFVSYTKDTVRKCLEYALEVRRRVKEQLKKIGGMEFYDVHFWGKRISRAD